MQADHTSVDLRTQSLAENGDKEDDDIMVESLECILHDRKK